MTNSSRFEETMARNLARSQSGASTRWASSSTRRLKASQLSSRLKNRSSLALRVTGFTLISLLLPCHHHHREAEDLLEHLRLARDRPALEGDLAAVDVQQQAAARDLAAHLADALR